MAAPLETVVPNRYDNNPQKREISLEEEEKKKVNFIWTVKSVFMRSP